MPKARNENELRNCLNCAHLSYSEKQSYESSDAEGYYCAKRIYKTSAEESRHQRLLGFERYRRTWKKCHEKAAYYGAGVSVMEICV